MLFTIVSVIMYHIKDYTDRMQTTAFLGVFSVFSFSFWGFAKLASALFTCLPSTALLRLPLQTLPSTKPSMALRGIVAGLPEMRITRALHRKAEIRTLAKNSSPFSRKSALPAGYVSSLHWPHCLFISLSIL